ncbi:DUF1127 domain-containing protein [Chelativorans sp.]|uniref:DUF1127 domain-containing protein n=1 Tax=Chelativorans sp. TaxID=2203393 RepID=UPI002811112B|nr:DUF1127 domain-containing protein [Chelativorans sp.]
MQTSPAVKRTQAGLCRSRFRRSVSTLLRFILRLEARRRQRLHLSELDDHLLADIGLRPEDVRRECTRPFWR